VVGLLFVSVVGIPFGIRQLVRYQLAPQAVMLEGADGASALSRSRALVHGRWWRTALVVAHTNAAVLLGGAVIGLVMLLVFTSLPLWLLSVVVSVVSALLMPLAALTVTLLYGDEVAARAGAGELTG
jgi:hypothetical protein